MQDAGTQQVGHDVAQRYLDASDELRAALGIPAKAPLSARSLAQGEHNSNFWFAHPETGERFVLRVNYVSQMNLPRQAEYEFNVLKGLESSGCTPRALFVDESRTIVDRALLVTTFCDGEGLDYLKLRDVTRAARLLADVHAVSVPPESGIIKPDDPLHAQYLECAGMFERYRTFAGADPFVLSIVEDMLSRARRSLDTPCPASDCRHILNTEAIAAHFRFTGSDDAGSFLDWEKAVVGEVAQDVAYFLSPTTTIWDTRFIFDDAERETFVREYWRAVDGRFGVGAFEERFGAYVMMNCLRGITWSAKAIVDYADPSVPIKNEKTRKKLAEYVDHAFLESTRERFFL